MKLKSFAVITLLVLGCSAAFAQSYAFGFESYTGGLQYCDYELLSVSAPFAAGIHNLTTVCGFPYDGTMVGTKGTIPSSTGLPVTGSVYTLADSVIDAEYLAFSGEQIYWITQLKAAKGKHPKYGWEFLITGYESYSAFLGNYGYLTTTLGSKVDGQTKTSYGVAKAKLAKLKK